MKYLLTILLSIVLVGCSNKEEEAEKQRKEKLENMYKTPPPSDRSKNKGF